MTTPQGVFPTTRRMLFCMVVLGLSFLVELLGGTLGGSLSLVSDAFHLLADVLAIFLSLMAGLVSHWKLPTQRMTYGYHRLEVFSAILNGLSLMVIAVYIMIEALEKFFFPRPVHIAGTLVVAFFGLVVNLFCMRMLKEHRHDLNIRSAYLHLWADVLSSVSVVVGTSAIYLTGFDGMDGIVAFFIASLILVGALKVFASGATILLQQSPHELERIRERVRQVQGVIDIEDVRLWRVCASFGVGTAHVLTHVERLEETEEISRTIREVLFQEFGIRHLTLEFETPQMAARHSHELKHRHSSGL